MTKPVFIMLFQNKKKSVANYMLNTFFKVLCFCWGNLAEAKLKFSSDFEADFIIEMCLTGACSSPTPATHLSWVAIKE